MHPWKVSLGLTIAVVACLVFVAASRFDYLSPYRQLILTEYWWPVALYTGSAVLTVVVALAGILPESRPLRRGPQGGPRGAIRPAR